MTNEEFQVINERTHTEKMSMEIIKGSRDYVIRKQC